MLKRARRGHDGMCLMTHPLLSLSPTQSAVRTTIVRFRLATSSQLRRLHYRGTDRGTKARSSDHLKKLTERGVIRRLPYKLNGYGRGSGEYVYSAPESTIKMPNLHILAVTELYVRLTENKTGAPTDTDDICLQPPVKIDSLIFDPEPWSHKVWGGHKVTPDAYIRTPGAHFFAEIDLDSEAPAVIAEKMKRYVSAYNNMDGGTFPYVIWIAYEPDRVRTLQRAAKARNEPGLFQCVLFDDAINLITKGIQ